MNGSALRAPCIALRHKGGYVSSLPCLRRRVDLWPPPFASIRRPQVAPTTRPLSPPLKGELSPEPATVTEGSPSRLPQPYENTPRTCASGSRCRQSQEKKRSHRVFRLGRRKIKFNPCFPGACRQSDPEDLCLGVSYCGSGYLLSLRFEWRGVCGLSGGIRCCRRCASSHPEQGFPRRPFPAALR